MALALQDQWRAAFGQRIPTGRGAVNITPRWHVIDIRASTFPPFTALCGRTLHLPATSLTGTIPDDARCFKCLIAYRTAIGTALVL